MPPPRSTTLTDWPTLSRTVAPLSATVSVPSPDVPRLDESPAAAVTTVAAPDKVATAAGDALTTAPLPIGTAAAVDGSACETNGADEAPHAATLTPVSAIVVARTTVRTRMTAERPAQANGSV